MADEQAAAGGSLAGESMTTSLNRPWLVKMVVFVVVLVAFGVWGLYDAMLAYPARGAAHAEYAELQYLKAAKLSGNLAGTADGVSDPRARLKELSQKTRSDLEQTQYDWLVALSRLGRLSPEATRVDGPNQRLDSLTAKWTGLAQPLPLEAYDLPFQWSIVAAGFGLAAVVAFNVLKSAAKRYAWEPATRTLTLPGGRRVRAEDLTDVDKRKWHKFFCTLVLTDGTAVELDVLKYSGLEDWVLTLERERFPDRAEKDEEAQASAEAEVEPGPVEPAP